MIDNVGSVLVADATGSGKTRMGSHPTRPVRDLLYQTGRVRQDLAGAGADLERRPPPSRADARSVRRFTMRRTKRMLNELVAATRAPAAIRAAGRQPLRAHASCTFVAG